MSNIAIRVEHLSKQYHIRSSKDWHDRLGDKLADGLRSIFGRNGRLHLGQKSFWALRDICLEVKQGEVIGFIGGNGAGKTTLLKILSRITEPTEGRAQVYGRMSSLLEVGTGFVGDLSGRENIYLSGAILGMRKLEIQQICLGKLGEVAKEGRTVLFVSHNMAAVQGLCSKCYMLKGGQLVAQGAPRTVIEQYMAITSSGQVTQVGDRQDRQGTGEIRIEEISICDGKGCPIDNALSGQDISIPVSYRSRDDKPVSRLDIHITFYTTLGQFMFNCSSEASGHPFEVLPPKGRVVCHIPQLPLAPGRYVFNVFSTVGGVMADWVTQAGSLNVVAGDFFGTGQLKTHNEGFLVKHKWTVSSANSTFAL